MQSVYWRSGASALNRVNDVFRLYSDFGFAVAVAVGYCRPSVFFFLWSRNWRSLSGDRGRPSLPRRIVVHFHSPRDIVFRCRMISPATCVPPSVIVSSYRDSDKMTLGDCTASAGSRESNRQWKSSANVYHTTPVHQLCHRRLLVPFLYSYMIVRVAVAFPLGFGLVSCSGGCTGHVCHK